MTVKLVPPPADEPSELGPYELVTRLAIALRDHGVTLPSLSVDRVTELSPLYGRPLLELGRINCNTAARLLSVLTQTLPAETIRVALSDHTASCDECQRGGQRCKHGTRLASALL